jgi:hypothetical protein
MPGNIKKAKHFITLLKKILYFFGKQMSEKELRVSKKDENGQTKETLELKV